MNKLIESNREGISKAIDYAAENDGATAALGLSAGASLAGAAASKIGLTAIGGAAGSAGTLGLATVGGAVGASELSEYLNGKLPGYGQASREFDDWLKDITGLKTIKSPLQLINDVFAPGDSGMGVERSVEDSVPAIDRDAREEDRQANADALAGALSKTPVKVQNNVDMTIQLDGQALESKITQVNERQNYETLSDLATTTER